MTTPPIEALRDIDPDGDVIRAVLQHINERPIDGWTVFTVEKQPDIELRMVSTASEDHLVLVVREKKCVERFVYLEPLESAQRRVRLRMPDLVIQPA